MAAKNLVASGSGSPVESTGAVARAVRVLRALAENPGPQGIAALSAQLGLAVSTVHRLLKLLAQEGMVSWDANTHLYSVGTEYYRMSAKVVAHTTLTRLARPALVDLAGQFNETVLLGVRQSPQHGMMFADRADGTQALQYRVQMYSLNSLVQGASGKSILAFMTPEEIQAELDVERSGAPSADAPIPSLSQLAAELNSIRKDGYAISEGEKLPGARGVAAPVFGPHGVVGSICLTSPAARLPHASISTIAAAIKDRALRLSELLGAEVPSTRRPLRFRREAS